MKKEENSLKPFSITAMEAVISQVLCVILSLKILNIVILPLSNTKRKILLVRILLQKLI